MHKIGPRSCINKPAKNPSRIKKGKLIQFDITKVETIIPTENTNTYRSTAS